MSSTMSYCQNKHKWLILIQKRFFLKKVPFLKSKDHRVSYVFTRPGFNPI